MVEDGKRLEWERRKLNESAENREMMKPLGFARLLYSSRPRPLISLFIITAIFHSTTAFSCNYTRFPASFNFCCSVVMVRPKMAGTGGSASKKEIKKSESQMMRAGDKRKRKHSRKESYSVYIYRVLKQVCTSNFRPWREFKCFFFF